MKKVIIIIAVVVVIAAVFLFFAKPVSTDHSVNRTDPNDNPNKLYIGLFEPLTGASATGGNQEALGIRFAHNDEPTVDIDGVTYDVVLSEADNMSEDSIAKATAQMLVDKNVSIVLGSYGSGLSLSGAEIFEKAGIPAIGVSCTNPKVTREHELYYRVCYLDSFQGKVMANFAQSRNYRLAAVLTQIGDVYSKGLGESFTSEFEALGGKTVQLTFNSAQTSFSELVEDIRRSKANFVFLPAGIDISAMIINEAYAKDLRLPFLAGDTWDSAVFWRAVEKSKPEVYFSSYFDGSDSDSKAASDFAVRFQVWVSRDAERLKLNGGSSDVAAVSALGYDAYMVALEAVKAAKSTQPAKISEALAEVSYTGATGEIVFDANGDPGKSTAYIKTFDGDGALTTIQKSRASD